jgi:hypothetical protein
MSLLEANLVSVQKEGEEDKQIEVAVITYKIDIR